MWESFKQLDTQLKTAIISVIVSMITVIVSTPIRHWMDKRLLKYKLDVEYEYEQRKRLREMIGSYHGRILESALSLNYRIWNLYANETRGWLDVDGNYGNPSGYYFQSSVFRFLRFYSLVLKFENEAQFIDSRIADEKDLDFVRFMKAFVWVMSDVDLFNGLLYDISNSKDHFFRDQLSAMCDSCHVNGNFVGMREFVEILDDGCNIIDALRFFDGLKADEDRLRWDRIVSLDLLLMVFINSFGYKWQRSSRDDLIKVIGKYQNREVVANFGSWLPKLG